MSQTKTKANDTSFEYSVKLSYFAQDIGEDGKQVVMEKKDQVIKLFRLQRLNEAHSRFALKVFDGKADEIDMSKEFVEVCVVDQKVRDELLKDSFACLDLFSMNEVADDLKSFFDQWGLLRRMKEKPSANK